MEKNYVFAKEVPRVGKEDGDIYDGEFGTSEEDIKRLLEKGIIREETYED